jgi:hypothetical protein
MVGLREIPKGSNRTKLRNVPDTAPRDISIVIAGPVSGLTSLDSSPSQT